VYYVPEMSNFCVVNPTPGCDASNNDDEELEAHEVCVSVVLVLTDLIRFRFCIHISVSLHFGGEGICVI
jgi:hypothetical protein